MTAVLPDQIASHLHQLGYPQALQTHPNSSNQTNGERESSESRVRESVPAVAKLTQVLVATTMARRKSALHQKCRHVSLSMVRVIDRGRNCTLKSYLVIGRRKMIPQRQIWRSWIPNSGCICPCYQCDARSCNGC